MRSRKRLYALVTASFFGLSTLVMIRFPVILSIKLIAWLQQILYVTLVPGFLIGFAIGGNIHVAQSWIVVTANFVIYFGLANLAATLWEKHKAKSERDKVLSSVPKSSGI